MRIQMRVDATDVAGDLWLSLLRAPRISAALRSSTSGRRMVAAIAKRKAWRTVRHHLQERRDATLDEKLDVDFDKMPLSEERSVFLVAEEILSALRDNVPGRDCEVIKLRMDGLTLREIGQCMSIDETSVRRSIARSIIAAKDFVKKGEDE